ncbi:SDR family NAD(P)-dependent oxidoreductase [Actinomadura decatromicini]|uniref:SDR family oxidoreductase n=1 Tax=Actinomadura decatromicini TaxID=2604572 RepID=A0A5D3FYI3_9ACTN|nr:SDR family oxidoreductase [Actinomadura decatromicini]TYK53079.1 SDR family oxidoreductase [Actinomadura decatromicini]
MTGAGRLDGRRALVTGGAGGAGAASVRRFAAEGAHVVFADVDVPGGRALEAEIAAAGGRAHFVETDVSRADDVRRCAETAVQRLGGGVDILFNHAGTVLVERLVDTSEDDWNRLLAVNVTSMFLMCREVLPHMMRARHGVVLNTSSISGLTASPFESAYCVTKGAVLQLTRAIAVEYREYGIRANALCPGFIGTPHGRREIDELTARGAGDVEADIAARQGRLCTPEEIAAAALALVGDDTAVVNGAALVADNGWTALT